jgi:hypothetical protein
MSDFRCPYCVSHGQFRLMIMADNGLYRCETCGHEGSTEFTFKCSCAKCLEWQNQILTG